MLHLPRVPFTAAAMVLALAAAISPEAHGQLAQQPAAVGASPTAGATSGGPSAAEWLAMGKTFTFEGHKVFYVDQGSGSVTLAIHGYPTSSWDFRRLLAPLTREARLVAPDLLGFGYSAKPADLNYNIAKHADLVAALTGHLGVTRARLIGSDVGNAVVQELLARERAGRLPFSIESVVLINGTLFAEQFQPSNAQRALLSPLGAMINRSASEDTLVGGLTQISGPERRIPASEFGDAWRILNHPADARLMHKTLPSLEERQTNDARWTEALCASTTPLKLVVGTADPTAGRAMAEATNARCNGARRFATLQLDKAGHFPHLEYAEETASAILAWRAGGY